MDTEKSLPAGEAESQRPAPSAGTDQIGELIGVLREIAGHLAILTKAGVCAAPLTLEEQRRAKDNYYRLSGQMGGGYYGSPVFEALDAVTKRWWLNPPVPENASHAVPAASPEAKKA